MPSSLELLTAILLFFATLVFLLVLSMSFNDRLLYKQPLKLPIVQSKKKVKIVKKQLDQVTEKGKLLKFRGKRELIVKDSDNPSGSNSST